jgi:hypothetical protein
LDTSAPAEAPKGHPGLLDTYLGVQEAGARGLTFGLSDVAAGAALGDDYSTRARERREGIGPLATYGEVAGAVGGTIGATLLPGGAPAAGGRLLSALTAPGRVVAGAGRLAEGAVGALGVGGKAGRALGMGAAGAAEGFLVGAGEAASAAALENRDLTAEKLLAAGGHGAVFGAVGGTVLGGVAGLASKAPGALKRALGGADDIANESAIKALGARGEDFRRLKTDEKIAQVGEDLRNYIKPDGKPLMRKFASPEDLADDVARARTEIGERLNALKGQVDDLTRRAPELSPDVSRYLKRVDDEILAPLKASKSPTVRARAEAVEREIEGLRELTASASPVIRRSTGEVIPRRAPSFGEVDAIRRDLRSVFQPAKPKSGGLPPPPPAHAAELERAERMLADELGESAVKALDASGLDSSVWKATNRQYESFRAARDIVEKATKQDLGNRYFSPSDHAMGIAGFLGAMATGNVAAIAAGPGLAIANKLLRERGRSAVASMADAVAKFDRRLDASVAGALRGEKVATAAKRAAPVAAASLAVDEMQPLITAKGSDADRYRATMARVIEFSQDPTAAAKAVGDATADVAEDAPWLTDHMQDRVARTAAFLRTKMPMPLSRDGASLTPWLEERRVPPAEMRKFLRYERVMREGPKAILDDLASGKNPREGVEFLKATSPELYQDLRTRVIRAVADQGEKLPYSRRIMFSMAFEFTGDKSLEPAYMSRIQSGMAPAAPPEQGGGGGGAELSEEQADAYAPPTQQHNRASGAIGM